MSSGILYFLLAYEILKLAVNHNIIQVYDQTMSRAKGPDRNIETFIFFPPRLRCYSWDEKETTLFLITG